MRAGGRLDHVLACLDDLGRFYDRGKIGPNTDFLNISYLIISVFSLDQRASAPPGKHGEQSDLAQHVSVTY
jgi:hypothetical protein